MIVKVYLDTEQYLVPCSACGRGGALWQVTQTRNGTPQVRYLCRTCGVAVEEQA